MKVKELIEALSSQDQNADVLVCSTKKNVDSRGFLVQSVEAIEPMTITGARKPVIAVAIKVVSITERFTNWSAGDL